MLQYRLISICKKIGKKKKKNDKRVIPPCFMVITLKFIFIRKQIKTSLFLNSIQITSFHRCLYFIYTLKLS